MKAYNHIAYSEGKEHRLNLPEINFKAMTARKEDNDNLIPTHKEAIKQRFHMTFNKCFNKGEIDNA